MKTISSVLFLISLSFLALHRTQAKEENGLRVEVQKTTISNDDQRRSGGYLERIDRTLGLKIFAKNISMKDLGPGKVEWIILVERWGYSPRRLERYKGTEPMKALRVGEEVTFTVGESQVGGYKYDKEYQDKIEGWSVTLFHDDKPSISLTSGSSFERLNTRAKEPSQTRN